MPNDPEILLWLDFETNGLDPRKHIPIEVAAVLTTPNDLEEISPWVDTLLYCGYDPFDPRTSQSRAVEMHEASGLKQEWQDSWNRIPTLNQVESQLTRMIDDQNFELATLAGSGVGPFDLQVIKFWMPRLADRLSYHVHDVGVMRRAYRRAVGYDLVQVEHGVKHRARADVQFALTQGRAFRDAFRELEQWRDGAARRAREQGLLPSRVLERWGDNGPY